MFVTGFLFSRYTPPTWFHLPPKLTVPSSISVAGVSLLSLDPRDFGVLHFPLNFPTRLTQAETITCTKSCFSFSLVPVGQMAPSSIQLPSHLIYQFLQIYFLRTSRVHPSLSSLIPTILDSALKVPPWSPEKLMRAGQDHCEYHGRERNNIMI